MSAEMLDRPAVLDLYRRHVNASLATICELAGMPLHVASAGAEIYDEKGTAYLDCGGFGVFLLGHRHPVVLDAVRRQLDEHPLVSRPLLSPATARAAAALAGVAPAGLDRVYLTCSGAEAVEVALKIVRLHGRTRVVAMDGGFHGKTFGALSVTGRVQYREPFEPLVPAVEFARFGDVEDLERRLAHDGSRTCVLAEPVQGEGGVRVPPPGWLSDVRRLCTEHGALLVLDEIQTGLGRVGRWWASEGEDVVPDVLLAGKTLSGGVVPSGAVVTSGEVFRPLDDDPMLHSSTFAGSPLAAAAAEATIRVLQAERLVERSAALGAELLDAVRTAVDTFCPHLVRDVRGQGLLIGVEFVSADVAMEFLLALVERRVVPSYSLNRHDVVRLTPPAVLDAAQVAHLRGALEEAAEALGRSRLLAPLPRPTSPAPEQNREVSTCAP
ncbi:MAG: aspartate aminotransferase family protein [Actinomycetes bacterium]